MEDPNHPDWSQFDISISEDHGGMAGWIVICEIPIKFGPVAPITPCGRFDDPRDPDDPGQGPRSNTAHNEFPGINTPVYFTDTPFDMAMKVAAFNTTVADTANGNDLVAADMYYELLYLAQSDSNITDSMAVVIEKMRWSGLNNYKATIERLFADSVLSRTDNQTSFEPTLENYVDVLMHFTDSIKTDKNYKQQFQLEIWKSSLLSTIGKKQQALHILSNINYCDHDSIQKIILLEHIQSLEFDLHRSQLDIHTFLTDSVTFVVDSSIYEIPLESYISTTGFGSYIMSPNSILFSACNTATKPSSYGWYNGNIDVVLYPNPAQDYLNISILNEDLSSESILTLRIFELTGKEVFNTKLPAHTVRVTLPDMANALYIYQLELDNQLIDQGKISIME